MFEDRIDAGEKLARHLCELNISADVVLAVPRGGVVIGRVIADQLGIPLDIAEAQKIGSPGNPELGIGAVTAGGHVWLNEPLIEQLAIDEEYVRQATEAGAARAREKAQRYREDRLTPDLKGRRVIMVDDGIATGGTINACIREIRGQGAKSIVLAMPVAPPQTVERLRREVDQIVCLEVPPFFEAVGQFYRNFEQVSDEEVLKLLNYSNTTTS